MIRIMRKMINNDDPAHSNRTALRLWQIAAFAYFCFTLYALFSPNPRLEKIGIPTFSLIHTAAFIVLGGVVEIGRVKFPFCFALALLLLYGPLTEFLQPLTGRYFEWMDILEDLIGVVIGVGLALQAKRFWPFRLLYN